MLSLEEQIERIADAAMAASLESDHDAVVPSGAQFRRRSWVGVAAAVMLVGLVGVLIGVVANRDRPSGTADDPAPTTAPMALGQTESLSPSEWVVASVLADGLEYLFPLAGEGGASKTVWYGTRRIDGASEHLRVSAGMQEPLGTGEPVDIDGDTWTVSQPGTGGWTAARPVGTNVVAVSGRGTFDDTARAVIAGLVVIPQSALPSEPLGPRERAVDVATTEFDGIRHSLAIHESNGFACTWVFSTDGSSSGGCGSFMNPSALLEITGGNSSQVEDSDEIHVASGGTVTKDATRVDVEFVDGTIITATPGDLSGQHDQNFWIVATDVGPDTRTGRVPTQQAVKEVRAYGTDGRLIAAAAPPP
jgi:hypothetical protein